MNIELLKNALKDMARNGEIDFPIDDEMADIIISKLEPVELTEEEYKKMREVLAKNNDR